MVLNKLCIGTVQFGISYGINNTFGIPTLSEIEKIVLIAKQSKINILDTAHVYGNSESKIGEITDGEFRIVTKFSKVATEVELNNELQVSLNNLKTKSIYGYLAHNADTLIENPFLWKTLQNYKELKLVQKIGYSLYSCEQLEKLLDLNLIPDLVQIPYSLLDRKFEVFLPKLKMLGIEIHVRSVFLQGLYFMNPLNLPVKLLPLKPELLKLHEYCQSFNVSIGSLALNFAIINPDIDKVVIGVDSSLQLQQNINTIQVWNHNQQLLDCVNTIEVINKELLNPANW